MTGDSIDTPQVANLINPLPTQTTNGMQIDMHKFAEAAKRLGAEKGDVMTIDGHRNAKGQWVPDYNTIRIVKGDGE